MSMKRNKARMTKELALPTSVEAPLNDIFRCLYRTARYCFGQSTAAPMWLAVYRQGIDVPTKISAARSSATISKPWACLRMTVHC